MYLYENLTEIISFFFFFLVKWNDYFFFFLLSSELDAFDLIKSQSMPSILFVIPTKIYCIACKFFVLLTYTHQLFPYFSFEFHLLEGQTRLYCLSKLVTVENIFSTETNSYKQWNFII